MGVAEAGAFSISGGWDVFDRAAGVANWIESHMEPIEYHPDEGEDGGHLFDQNEEAREKLRQARAMIQKACLLCQQALEAI